MSAGYTYSFNSVKATLIGPGAAINLGNGASVSKEGITIEPSGPINTMTVGADGQGMHSLHMDKSGHVTARFLKDSPVNSQLATLYAIQTASAPAHGLNTITISNIDAGDVITCQQCAFQKAPTVVYAEEGGMMEWAFDSVQIDRGLG